MKNPLAIDLDWQETNHLLGIIDGALKGMGVQALFLQPLAEKLNEHGQALHAAGLSPEAKVPPSDGGDGKDSSTPTKGKGKAPAHKKVAQPRAKKSPRLIKVVRGRPGG